MALERKHVNRTMYDDMAFPDYEFREFPMEVPYADGEVKPTPYDKKNKPWPTVKVNSQAELDELKGGEAEVIPQNYEKTVSRVKTEDDEREELVIRARQLKINVDGRWKIDRIRAAIAEAEEDGVL